MSSERPVPTERDRQFARLAIVEQAATPLDIRKAERVLAQALRWGDRLSMEDVLRKELNLDDEVLGRIRRRMQAPGAGGSPPRDPQRFPRRIAGYRLMGILGRGGMGIVYKAYQVNMERVVALKVLSHEMAKDATTKRRR